MTIKVGDKLWFVSGQNKPTQAELAVTKIGRTYITATHHGRDIRFEKDTLREKRDCAPGRAYLSQQHYIEESALGDAWDKFRLLIRYHSVPPEIATVETIRDAAKSLGLEMPSPKP